jgi:hypothetical protein
MNQHNSRAPFKRITKEQDEAKGHYSNRLAKSARFQEGDQVSLYHLLRTRRKLLAGKDLQGDHLDQQCSLQDPASSQGEDGDAIRQTALYLWAIHDKQP